MIQLDELSHKWNSIHHFSNPIQHILKIDILRDAYFFLHNLHSAQQTNNQEFSHFELTQMEQNIINSISKMTFTEDFIQILRNNQPPPPPIEIPKSLFQIIKESKLNRFDRVFEKSLAYFGYKENCTFFELTYKINLKNVQKFHENLKTKLWPHALVLFVEGESDNASSMKNHWTGIWTIMLLPQTTTDQVALLLEKTKQKFVLKQVS